MPSTVVVGGFFGDEGKGKIISYLALKDNPSIVVRGGAGPNAGHTVQDGDRIYKIRMLPSGLWHFGFEGTSCQGCRTKLMTWSQVR